MVWQAGSLSGWGLEGLERRTQKYSQSDWWLLEVPPYLDGNGVVVSYRPHWLEGMEEVIKGGGGGGGHLMDASARLPRSACLEGEEIVSAWIYKCLTMYKGPLPSWHSCPWGWLLAASYQFFNHIQSKCLIRPSTLLTASLSPSLGLSTSTFCNSRKMLHSVKMETNTSLEWM